MERYVANHFVGLIRVHVFYTFSNQHIYHSGFYE
uniref:Uncharacterized protein n=1 Tax=Anguilla anguilla TaxID=7936 RepID=A0A0E9RSE6_ANGAN